eukprot:4372677-Amphidinium_carterae.1
MMVAAGLTHPFFLLGQVVPDDVLLALLELLTSPRFVDSVRAELDRWRRLSRSLAQRTRSVRASLRPGPARILEGVDFLLFSALLKELDWDDTGLVTDLLVGMPVAGAIPLSHVFPAQTPPPATSVV